jgi:hypothetical protein
MPAMPVILKPGPQRIAAAMLLAGFSETVTYPDVTDACGKVWKAPNAVLIATSIAGGESSGNAWVYRDNTDGTTDFGLMEINQHYNTELYPPTEKYPSHTDFNWAIHTDNAKMAYAVYQKAIVVRKSVSGPVTDDWKPWHAYAGITRERYNNLSWMSWAQYGIDGVHTLLKAGSTLDMIASIDLDPLVYGQKPLLWS